jgi:hypothetical protein
MIIARAGLLVDKDTILPDFVLRGMFGVRSNHLAAALVELALKGYEKGGIVYAGDLVELGAKVVDQSSG